MKIAGVVILFLCLLVQTFSRAWVVAGWQANRDYAARVLCENKSRPQLKCGGKCQLRKNLAAEEQKDPSGTGGQQSKGIDFSFIQDPLPVTEVPVAWLSAGPWPELLTLAPVDRAYAPFHPPGRI
ncbi:MAG TPA: hypothetical protein VHK69_17975 [Chitinophagaceae bacterium]|nr:hypothetical protein [Chitinophagaceae bacterium]